MPDDGNRYEWIAGRLHVTAAPGTRHQLISKRLQWRFAEQREAAEPFSAVSASAQEAAGRPERFTSTLPVMLPVMLPGTTTQVGSIDLDQVFSRRLDTWRTAVREG